MINVAVLGAAGRMGTAVSRAIDEAPDIQLVASLDEGEIQNVAAYVVESAQG